MKKHNCGLCKVGFDTDEEYCGHACGVTGVTPADIEHQGPEFIAISEAALKRGEDKKNEVVVEKKKK